MKEDDEIGDWKRTHYSVEIGPRLDGAHVTLFGWVSSVRRQTGIEFIILSDKDGTVQLTIHRKEAKAGLVEKALSVTEHSSVGVKGLVRVSPRAPGGAEIIPSEVRILGRATSKPPFSVFGGKLPSLEKRLDLRPVDLRRRKPQALFRIYRQALSATREFFVENGYVEVRTPKIISTASEGGAALFSVLYYNRPAFLVQSPQLYKEHLVMPFEKVFEVGPAFRAEESRTQKHLSEITSVDMEEAFTNNEGVMDTLEALVRFAVTETGRKCRPEYSVLGRSPPMLPERFPRPSYDELFGRIEAAGRDVSWGEDISGLAAELFSADYPSFYFITGWPTSSKPFYIRPSPANPKVSESFDLMHGPLELASGGARLNSRAQLVKRLKDQKLKPQAFEYHLNMFDYGMPPHGGFGLGFERLMMVLASEENIREVTLYPRDKLRLVP